MAGLMRRFSDKTGINLGEQMEEALSRLEAGEDPEIVEKEMEGLLDDNEEPFSLETMKKKVRQGRAAPNRDEKLYRL